MPRQETESMRYVQRVLQAITDLELDLLPHNFDKKPDLVLDLDIDYDSKFIIQARKKVYQNYAMLAREYISLEESRIMDLELNLKKGPSMTQGEFNVYLVISRRERSFTVPTSQDLANLLKQAFKENNGESLGNTILTMGTYYEWQPHFRSMWAHLSTMLKGRDTQQAINLLLTAHGLTWSQFILSLSIIDQRKFIEHEKTFGLDFNVFGSKQIPYLGKGEELECWTPLALLSPGVKVEFNTRYSNDKKPYVGTIQSIKSEGKRSVIVCYPETADSYEQKMFTIPTYSVSEHEDDEAIDGVFVRVV